MSTIKCLFFTLLFLGLSLANQLSMAHEIRPALLKLTAMGNGQWQATFKQPQVDGRFLNLGVRTNCSHSEKSAVVSESALKESFVISCNPDEPLAFVEIPGIDRTLIDAMVTITGPEREISNHLISASRPTLLLGSSVPAVPAYLMLGVEHLLFGIDHVLFVLVLLYLVQGFTNLIKVVTSFTLAHSITLGLAAFDVIRVAQTPIEALIALSIVLLAREGLNAQKGLISRKPWLVAFAFGLLHGLGFAGALAAIGLPEGNMVPALFLFNVGIELGQLAIVAAAVMLLWVIGRSQLKVHPALIQLPVYCVGGLATYWFIERGIGIAA